MRTKLVTKKKKLCYLEIFSATDTALQIIHSMCLQVNYIFFFVSKKKKNKRYIKLKDNFLQFYSDRFSFFNKIKRKKGWSNWSLVSGEEDK